MRHAAPRSGRGGRGASRDVRLVDEQRGRARRALGVSRIVGPGDAERGDRVAVGAEDRRGEGGEAELELVDRRRLAGARGSSRAARRRRARRGEGEQDLAVRGQWYGHAPADPVRPADEVPASPWARCSTPSGLGTARLIVSPVSLGERAQRGRGDSTRLALAVAVGEAEEHRPGATRPVARRWTRPCRSSAPTSREVVHFGSPARSASSPTAERAARLDHADEQLAPRGRSPGCPDS